MAKRMIWQLAAPFLLLAAAALWIGPGLAGGETPRAARWFMPACLAPYLAGAGALYLFWFRKEKETPPLRRNSARGLLFAALAGAFALRLAAALAVSGYEADVNLFKAWAVHAFESGLPNFYDGSLFADYPPGYIYILYLIGAVRHLFALEYDSSAFTLLVKLPAMTADLALGAMIFRWGLTEGGFAAPPSPKSAHSAADGSIRAAALAAAALYLFHPAAIVDSAAWGQADAVFMLAVMFAVTRLSAGRLPQASALFAAALLIKPQALLLGPLLIAAVIREKSWKTIGRCAAYGLIVFLLAALPFTFQRPGGPLWLFELYFGTLAQYPYASLNAYNLHALLGGNWQSVGARVFGLTHAAWSAIWAAAGAAFSLHLLWKSKERSAPYFAGFFLMASMFMGMVKMHERYLIYALPLLLMSWLAARDRRLLFLFAGLSATAFANMYDVLAHSLEGVFHIDRNDGLLRFISFANAALIIFAAKVGRDLYCRTEAKGAGRMMNAPKQMNRQAGPDAKAARMTRLDVWLMLSLTAVYAVIALVNLGSLRAPETYWMPAAAGERVIADFGETAVLDRVNSFAAVGNGAFRLELSEDGVNWKGEYRIERSGSNVFMWQTLPLNGESARYVRVTAEHPGVRLNELAFYAAGRPEAPLAAAVIEEPAGGGAAALFDEPDAAAYRPSFMNSMYFDEIYHGRTAYEHLHRIEPYESTHPPLGKVLISAGVALFGMNPFGWRIAGTVFGILMIPVMYAFARRLFGKPEYAFFAAFLLAFDFMHFVQTRIATIDVYAVFFILLMFYCMYRYTELNVHRDGLRKTFRPLALSGLMFGFGIAAKWISFYAGAGLAVLFFLSLAARWKEYRASRQSYPDFPRNALLTLLWCAVWFVIVPAVIYVLSYIPFMLVPGPGHGLKDVLSYQVHMYKYHSELDATHPFSSQWYEWPTMEKPVWYYMGSELPPGKTSVIVALGNPAVWGFIGIAAVVLSLRLGAKAKDRRVLFIAVALASVYVPWMLVPRLTFLYHFFAAVPFVILCIAYVVMRVIEHPSLSRKAARAAKGAAAVYLAAVLVLFAMFYPILSGAVVDRSYVETFLKWKDSWVF